MARYPTLSFFRVLGIERVNFSVLWRKLRLFLGEFRLFVFFLSCSSPFGSVATLYSAEDLCVFISRRYVYIAEEPKRKKYCKCG